MLRSHSSEKRFSPVPSVTFALMIAMSTKHVPCSCASIPKTCIYDCKFCNLSFVKAYDLKLHAMSEHNSLKIPSFVATATSHAKLRAEMKQQHRQTHTGSVEQHHQIRTSVQENSEPSENGFTKGLFRAEASNTADSANEERHKLTY
ncbi:hypothetical protein RRG08_025295 [Elysia crispata]|uniref:C2H2-type domain-containing protein n=1 Tax=Elysia crispata TaxID=231223 RepID=A0AAE1AN14_9GAST|nr:hypothetical protein RRG08_025295 [Elysia crispata]